MYGTLFWGRSITKITTAGGHTYNPPKTARFCHIILWGGGGAGGGAPDDGNNWSSGGGGFGGECVIRLSVPRRELVNSSFSIGAGGAGALGAAGAAGSNSTFTGAKGAVSLTAPGGIAGGASVYYARRFDTANPSTGSGGHFHLPSYRDGMATMQRTGAVILGGGGGATAGLTKSDAIGTLPGSGAGLDGIDATVIGAGGGGAAKRNLATTEFTGGDGAPGGAWIIEDVPFVLNVQTLTGSGTFSPSEPRAKRFSVWAQGAGGGGGGTLTLPGAETAAGMGGASGEMVSQDWLTKSYVDGASYACGAKGSGGTGASGSNGAVTTFQLASNVQITARAGVGGTAGFTSNQYIYAAADRAGTDLTGALQDYHTLLRIPNLVNTGQMAGNLDHIRAGLGGPSFFGRGGVAGNTNSGTANGSDSVSTHYGSGGGGGCVTGAVTATNGGDGADGCVIVVEIAENSDIVRSDYL